MKIISDHGYPVASDGTDDNALDAFKNERDYIAKSGRHKTTVAAMEWALREIEQLRTALAPFAAFAEKAETFVAARAKDGGSPIMPSSDFRLADFERAAAALSSQLRPEDRPISEKNREGGA